MQSLRVPRSDTAQRYPRVGHMLSSLTDNIIWSDGGQRLKQAPIRIRNLIRPEISRHNQEGRGLDI